MPKSLGSVLIWRRSTARMVPFVMGTSYALPVRLSVMVRVSRELQYASVLVVPAVVVRESIEQTSQQLTIRQRSRSRKRHASKRAAMERNRVVLPRHQQQQDSWQLFTSILLGQTSAPTAESVKSDRIG